MSPPTDPSRPLLALTDRLNSTEETIVTYEDVASTNGSPFLPSLSSLLADTSGDPAAKLRQLASEYELRGGVGAFEVAVAAPMIHVIGRTSRSEGALLDRVISLSPAAGTGMEFVAALIDALGGRSTLGVGMVPLNVLTQHQGQWEAHEEPARTTLRHFAASVDGVLSWSVLYDAADAKHVLNMTTAYQRRHVGSQG